ncbi:MAG: fimbria/pilus outer membrane usher protein [Deltaproteobacteria bacterium]|nr:fimbria/pilus outer membrane usher protein [Deltaproteobacteria bacterium]
MGARAEEAGGGLLNAGGSITAAPVIGELELTGAVSRGAGGTVGGAGSIAWSYLGGNLGGGLVLRLQSPEYANVSQAASVDRALWTVNGYLNVPVGQRLTLTVDLLALQSRDSGQSGHATLRGQLSIAQQLALSASVGMQADPLLGRPGLMADVGLFWTLGQRQASALSGSRDATGHSTGQMSSQLDLPTGDGYGYRVSTAASELPSVSAAALQQGEHERLEIGVDTSTHTTVGHATISGGVVALGGRVFFTRALDQSWALVRTGVPNVRSYLENHDIGRTDDDGDLLITGLHPYMANHIGIDPTDVPLTYELGDLEHLVAPYARGGLTVRFEVQKASAVAGTMQLVTDAPIEGPLGAELSVEVGGVQTSVPVGQQGRFFIEGLSAGKHEAEVVFNGGTCKLELDVPASGGYGAVIDLGDVPCAQTIASNR